jgi:hypothetical protein
MRTSFELVSYFSFWDHLAPSVSMMKMAVPLDAFPTSAIQFEEAKASQSDGDGSFELSLCASVKCVDWSCH